MTTPNHANTSAIENLDGRNGLGAGRRARVAIVLADNRPIALIFPASRRLVLDRLRKLLGADDVRLAEPDEVEKLERKFWALMRIMARKGLITKDEFREELDEGDD